jgi:hypothetical protein
VLEGEGDDVLDPLDRHRRGVSREAFADDNLDAAEVVARVPVVLLQELLSKRRKLQWFELAVLREVWAIDMLAWPKRREADVDFGHPLAVGRISAHRTCC